MTSHEVQALALELPAVTESVPTVRGRVAAWAEKAGASSEQLYAIKLVVTEAVSNAVLHAYREGGSGPVRVQGDVKEGHIVLRVADAGVGMTPQVDSPGLGMGLALIARLADGLVIVCTPQREAGAEVRVTFRHSEESAASEQFA